MDKKEIFEKVKSMMTKQPGSFSVLEEVVDIKTQMEYLSKTKKLRESRSGAQKQASEQGEFFYERPVESLVAELESTDTTLARKKNILLELAILEDIASFRAIERFRKTADAELEAWAIMAYRESKIRLENEFLDEAQVYISTAMGGKGNNLRFFVALESLDSAGFSALQMAVIERELKFALEKNEGEFESLRQEDEYALSLVLIPFSKDPSELIHHVIEECNLLGEFIKGKSVISNVEQLSVEKLRNSKLSKPKEIEIGESNEVVSSSDVVDLPEGINDLMNEIKNLISEQLSNFDMENDEDDDENNEDENLEIFDDLDS